MEVMKQLKLGHYKGYPIEQDIRPASGTTLSPSLNHLLHKQIFLYSTPFMWAICEYIYYIIMHLKIINKLHLTFFSFFQAC